MQMIIRADKLCQHYGMIDICHIYIILATNIVQLLKASFRFMHCKNKTRKPIFEAVFEKKKNVITLDTAAIIIAG